MNKSLVFAAALVLASACSSTMADSIGWHFSNGFWGYQSALAPADLAGAPGYQQTNWNNGLGVSQGPSPTPQSGLLNSSGVATGVALTSFTLATDNSWSMGDFSSPDAKLLSDFADQSPALSFSGIHGFTSDGYSVVVYYNNNEFPSSDSTLSVNGETKEIFTSGVTSSYIAAGATSAPSNYAVFTGVSGDVLNISLVGVNGANNDGISAVQIFSTVPEPSSLALGLCGLAALIAIKRRRRR